MGSQRAFQRLQRLIQRFQRVRKKFQRVAIFSNGLLIFFQCFLPALPTGLDHLQRFQRFSAEICIPCESVLLLMISFTSCHKC